MTHWIIFSTLATAVFYGFYCLAFKRDRWLQVSRWYLMGALLFSLVYPLLPVPEVTLPMPTMEESVAPAREFPAAEAVGTGRALSAEETVVESQPQADVARHVPMVMYLVGLVLAVISLLVRVVVTRRSLSVAGRTVGRFAADTARRVPTVVYLDDDTPPSSFFNHIIIGTRGMSDEELLCVLAHEREHVRRHHTEDVLFVRLLCCVAWFNPFAWLMLHELRAVHEYQADAAVLGDSGRMIIRPYMSLLYRQATGTGYGHITNNFQSINIKKRITMMNKTKSRFGAWKLLAVLPVAALLMAFGCRTENGVKVDNLYGNTLLVVDYHREGGKLLPFGGIGYNHVKGNINEYNRYEATVTCSDAGVISSYGAWEISEVATTKGVMDGKALNRNEKRMLKAVDRKLRAGKTEGQLVRHVRAKAAEGNVKLTFIATWHRGNTQGDAEIKLTVKEVVPIPDGRYVGQDYTDFIKSGRIVSRARTWKDQEVSPGLENLAIPIAEVEKVNTLIGSKAEVEEAMKNMQDEYRYVEMTQMHADEHDNYWGNLGNELWELSYTNDSQTWLAYKQQGKTYYTEAYFDGGESAMNQWVQTHLRYPEEARRDGVEKTVKMIFVVDEEGNIHDPICPNSPLINGLILNAMNMISNMPRWKPATFMGKPVSSRVYLPVTFKQ